MPTGLEPKRRMVVGDSDTPLPVNSTSKFNTNDIEEDSATVTYICMEDAEANWWIRKIDTSISNSFTHASIKNNPTITTYTDAHTGRAALTYGDYSEAF